MPRRLAALVVAAGALSSGCVSTASAPPPSKAASPQRAELGWVERSPETGPALVFRTHRFAVSERGWEADLEIENQTAVTWELGTNPVAVEQSFGLMLFATGTLEELERRNRAGELPGLRPARSFTPPLPDRLGPRTRWRGNVSARGSLAAGRYARFVFGPLVARGDPPQGMPDQIIWITDHAYRLRP